MQNILLEQFKDLKKYGVVGIKADLEAEYFSPQEQELLKQLSKHIDLTVKVGGCEAIHDLITAKNLKAKNIVAPMIESQYALQKYILATNKVLTEQPTNLFINIETKTAIERLDEILDSKYSENLTGIVIGRSDMAQSLGLQRNDVNNEQILEVVKSILEKAKKNGLDTIVGGNLTKKSIPFFKNIPEGLIDKIETRKVIFDYNRALTSDIEIGMEKAIEFEYFCIEQRAHYSKSQNRLDAARLDELKIRKR